MKEHLWVDIHQTRHQVAEGHNIISFVRTGALDYTGGTWTCRGGDRVNTQGNTEVLVLKRIHM